MAEEERPPPIPEFLIARSVPEFYVDQFQASYSSYTVMITFSVGAPGRDPRNEVIVRMSPEHAKMMAMLFKKTLKEYENETRVEIAIPPDLLQKHKVSLEQDW